MLKSSFEIIPKRIVFPNIKKDQSLQPNKSEPCPNCGNTSPIFQHFQNGMLVCFICRKATTISGKNFIASF